MSSSPSGGGFCSVASSAAPSDADVASPGSDPGPAAEGGSTAVVLAAAAPVGSVAHGAALVGREWRAAIRRCDDESFETASRSSVAASDKSTRASMASSHLKRTLDGDYCDVPDDCEDDDVDVDVDVVDVPGEHEEHQHYQHLRDHHVVVSGPMHQHHDRRKELAGFNHPSSSTAMPDRARLHHHPSASALVLLQHQHLHTNHPLQADDASASRTESYGKDEDGADEYYNDDLYPACCNEDAHEHENRAYLDTEAYNDREGFQDCNNDADANLDAYECAVNAACGLATQAGEQEPMFRSSSGLGDLLRSSHSSSSSPFPTSRSAGSADGSSSRRSGGRRNAHGEQLRSRGKKAKTHFHASGNMRSSMPQQAAQHALMQHHQQAAQLQQEHKRQMQSPLSPALAPTTPPSAEQGGSSAAAGPDTSASEPRTSAAGSSRARTADTNLRALRALFVRELFLSSIGLDKGTV